MNTLVQRVEPVRALLRAVMTYAGWLGRGGAGLSVPLVLVGLVSCSLPEPITTGPAPVPPAAACVLFDGDSNMDDLRALAVLWPHRRLAAVVTTDGIVSARAGAATVAQFFGGTREAAPVVIQGRDRFVASAAPPAWTWLAKTRADAERLATLFAAIVPFPLPVIVPRKGALGAAVAQAVADCSSVGVVITGPWSSFVAYHPAIVGKLKFAVVQGRSPDDPDDPKWDRVNCSFDRQACNDAVTALRSTPVFWVDLSAAGPSYPITADLATALSDSGLGGRLKQVMQRDGQWHDQQIWDDGAALFLIDPTRFKLVGRHIEPIPMPSVLILHEAQLINGIAR